jgi:hypothetical protein
MRGFVRPFLFGPTFESLDNVQTPLEVAVGDGENDESAEHATECLNSDFSPDVLAVHHGVRKSLQNRCRGLRASGGDPNAMR